MMLLSLYFIHWNWNLFSTNKDINIIICIIVNTLIKTYAYPLNKQHNNQPIISIFV